MKYRIYIDEVGNADMESSANPNHRFLSLTGVIIELGMVQRVVYPELEALKSRFFQSHPDEPVIFHRKEMINAKPPFESLRDLAIQHRFNLDLLAHLSRWDYTVISVCLDKQQQQPADRESTVEPYQLCLAFLLEKYASFLIRAGSHGDVMAESRGRKEDMRLKAAFMQLWEQGTERFSARRFQEVMTSKQMKVKTKANNISGLQLADMVAYPSRNEILVEQGLLNRPIAPFARMIIQVLSSKYDQDEEGVCGRNFLQKK